jgi:hypothetical protein
LFELFRRLKFAKGYIEAIVIVSIAEVVDVVALNRIFSIIKGTLPCPLASSCKIGL